MRYVWRCDFCDYTVTTDQQHLMIQHESKCIFNPMQQNCYSCKFMNSENGCIRGVTLEICEDIKIGKKICLEWERKNEKEYKKDNISCR